MCVQGALTSIANYLICSITTFRKTNLFDLCPHPGVEVECKDRICACMLLHSSCLLILYLVLKKLNFYLLAPRAEGDLQAYYLLSCCCMLQSL